MDRFAEIRPYNDDEVRPVIDNLLHDHDLINTIVKLRFGGLSSSLPWLFESIVRRIIRKETEQLTDIRSFQELMTKYIARMIRKTTSGFEFLNLDSLEKGQSYMFMSNHRDIALDPTFVNYALFCGGHDTAGIAIGDNLLLKPFATDLMKLNKCFIVKRSAKGPRQVLEAYKTLSAYILHSIENNDSLWMAQREGRAKDGNDFTDPAIIKMLAINRDRKKESLQSYIRRLSIVPVSISYEYDPCDGTKAREMYQLSEFGNYKKEKYEDLASMGMGISGQKGKVNLFFGKPLKEDFDTPEAIASELDRQIIGNYVLQPTNFFAYKQMYGRDPNLMLNGKVFSSATADYHKQKSEFEKRINLMPPEHRRYALGIYANPVVNKIRMMGN